MADLIHNVECARIEQWQSFFSASHAAKAQSDEVRCGRAATRKTTGFRDGLLQPDGCSRPRSPYACRRNQLRA